MNKNPYLNAFLAIVYIVLVVLIINYFGSIVVVKETILIPMVMLGLFVFSAATMGFLFISRPIQLFLENDKDGATTFFFKTVLTFLGFLAILGTAILYTSYI